LIHLYRIAQEAITNAARHSKAKHIEIRLSKENNEITMSIKDDGRGFVMAKHTDRMGLEIMKFRASIINASLDIRSDIVEGTVVSCIFLIKEKMRSILLRRQKIKNFMIT
jgi:signal transduction histidine kinase